MGRAVLCCAWCCCHVLMVFWSFDFVHVLRSIRDGLPKRVNSEHKAGGHALLLSWLICCPCIKKSSVSAALLAVATLAWLLVSECVVCSVALGYCVSGRQDGACPRTWFAVCQGVWDFCLLGHAGFASISSGGRFCALTVLTLIA